MTERRPHWDDELVYAVIHEIGVLRPSPHSLRDTAYAVIAAVEDWRNSNIQVHWQGMTATERNLSEALGREQRGRAELEAAIARVRQLHRTGPGEPTPGGSICGGCGHPWPCLTVQALDGDR